MEAFLHVHKGWGDGFFDPLNRWTKKRSPRLVLDGGTMGIAPTSLTSSLMTIQDSSRSIAISPGGYASTGMPTLTSLVKRLTALLFREINLVKVPLTNSAMVI